MKPPIKVDFIGIGAPKCGTTWLFYGLGQHPKICLSEPKEVNYFNSEDFSVPLAQRNGENHCVNVNHNKPVEWYARHFSHCLTNSLKGEFSPTYIYDKDAAKRIQLCFPDVKLLVCLRNPANNIYSIYWARRRYRKVETSETFEKALESDPRYLNQGYFGKHLKRFLNFFDRKQMKVVLLEDIVDRPGETIRDVFGFLNLDPDVPLDMQRTPKNRAKKSWTVSLEPWMKKFSAFLIEHNQAALLNRIRKLGIRDAVLKVSTVERQYPEMRPETRKQLNEIFHEDLGELETILERDLSIWR